MDYLNKEAKRAIYILIFGNFLICLGISLVIPVQPYIKKMYGYSTTEMGIMTSLYSLAQFIASPIVGRVSDIIGRKSVIVSGLILYFVSEVIFAMSNDLWLFDLSRIIGGLSAAMFIPTSMAMAADLTDNRHRARVIGWISAAFSGGLILGPGLGGLIAQISYKAPFWAAGLLGLLSTIFTQLLLQDQAGKRPTNSAVVNWRQLLTPLLIILFVMIFVSTSIKSFTLIWAPLPWC